MLQEDYHNWARATEDITWAELTVASVNWVSIISVEIQGDAYVPTGAGAVFIPGANIWAGPSASDDAGLMEGELYAIQIRNNSLTTDIFYNLFIDVTKNKGYNI